MPHLPRGRPRHAAHLLGRCSLSLNNRDRASAATAYVDRSSHAASAACARDSLCMFDSPIAGGACTARFSSIFLSHTANRSGRARVVAHCKGAFGQCLHSDCVHVHSYFVFVLAVSVPSLLGPVSRTAL